MGPWDKMFATFMATSSHSPLHVKNNAMMCKPADVDSTYRNGADLVGFTVFHAARSFSMFSDFVAVITSFATNKINDVSFLDFKSWMRTYFVFYRDMFCEENKMHCTQRFMTEPSTNMVRASSLKTVEPPKTLAWQHVLSRAQLIQGCRDGCSVFAKAGR